MRAITREEMGKISGGRQKMPTGGLVPELKKGPPGADSPTWTPAEEVEGITDSFMASATDGIYDNSVSSDFFTVADPADATDTQLNTTCSILESDCTQWETTGTHLDDFTGSTIDPDFIDWSAYGSSLGSAGAITFIENMNSALASGAGLVVDPNFGYLGNQCVEYSVDQNFVYTNENETDTLVADVPSDASGVTVAHGFDLNQHNTDYLHDIGLPDALIDKLLPYQGKQGYSAQVYLDANPLVLTPNQASLIDSSEWSYFLHSLATEYATATGGQEFYSLPADTQTAIADVQFQYGTSGAKDPQFWGDVTNWDWQAAYNELINFGDKYTSRRHEDAALLKDDLGAGNLPHH